MIIKRVQVRYQPLVEHERTITIVNRLPNNLLATIIDRRLRHLLEGRESGKSLRRTTRQQHTQCVINGLPQELGNVIRKKLQLIRLGIKYELSSRLLCSLY